MTDQGAGLWQRLVRWVFALLRRITGGMPYFYVLRVPMLIALMLMAVPWAAAGAAETLLGNLFDLDGWGIFLVSLAAFTTGWTVMVTGRLVILYAYERFGIGGVRPDKEIGARSLLLPFVIALPIVAMAIVRSTESLSKRLLWSAGGLLLSLLLLALAQALQLLFNPPEIAANLPALLFPIPRSWRDGFLRRLIRLDVSSGLGKKLMGWFRNLPEFLGRGYFRYKDGKAVELLPGQGLAISLFLIALLLYAIIGLVAGKYPRTEMDAIPALAYALLLILLLCWGISALAFFFDSYRFPVLIPIALILAMTAQFPQSDHFYRTSPLGQFEALPPNTVLRAGNRRYAIVVATNGGGIQSAAWTARVITGIAAATRAEFGTEFDKSVRLISSVSGGSVGAMYVVDAYGQDGIPNDQFEKIVARAAASSLNAVSWGLVYPDFLRVIFPVGDIKTDRGLALEKAWERNSGELPITPHLSQWREGVKAGWRPANIFNATITDTGQRLLISTTDFTSSQTAALLSTTDLERESAPSSPNDRVGRREFYQLYGEKYDIAPVTAARLSASFPYVTPAARADIGGATTPQYHVVDGGYFDNYGMASLVEWLDAALSDPNNPIAGVLVIQIRGEAPSEAAAPADARGWFYQAFAPLATLFSVRSTAQLSNNNIEFNLLQQKWAGKGVPIETALFEFNQKNFTCTEKKPPLSWHLNEKQKRAIQDCWNKEVQRGDQESSPLKQVKTFLNKLRATSQTDVDK